MWDPVVLARSPGQEQVSAGGDSDVVTVDVSDLVGQLAGEE